MAVLFDEIEELPAGLLTVSAREIKRVLPRPTLIHLPGERSSTLFVSVLLHGNEDVGLKAVQRVLEAYRTRPLPCRLSIFVGNVDAAEAGARYLPSQPDFNRIWPGSEHPETPEHGMMRAVAEKVVERGVSMSVDLHNNSGRNPHYACICSLNAEHIRLAALFSSTVMYFERPKGVQTQTFAQFCPSITCECGPIGDESGVVAAVELLQKCLELEHVSQAAVPDRSVRLYHTIATLRVKANSRFGFAKVTEFDSMANSTDLVLREDLEQLNFRPLSTGETLAYSVDGSLDCLEVQDAAGRSVTGELLACQNHRVLLRRAVIPSMLTVNPQAISQDCVGYFLERYPLSMQHAFLAEPDNVSAV